MTTRITDGGVRTPLDNSPSAEVIANSVHFCDIIFDSARVFEATQAQVVMLNLGACRNFDATPADQAIINPDGLLDMVAPVKSSCTTRRIAPTKSQHDFTTNTMEHTNADAASDLNVCGIAVDLIVANREVYL